MADVVDEGEGFGEFCIEAESEGEGAGDLRDFKRVGEAAAEVVRGRVAGQAGEDLGFAGEAAEGAGVKDAGGVAGKGRAVGVGRLGVGAAGEGAVESPRTAMAGGELRRRVGLEVHRDMGLEAEWQPGALTSGYTAEGGWRVQVLCPESL